MGSPRLDGRNGEVWQKWAVFSWTQERIADHFGISQQRVTQILADVRSRMTPVDRNAMIEQSREMLEDMRRRQMELAEQIKAGAPVAVGKDGNKLYEDDGTPVRDYSGYLKALAEVRATDQVIAKRFGLDAPDKVETMATVKYQIEGFDPSALT